MTGAQSVPHRTLRIDGTSALCQVPRYYRDHNRTSSQ
ncbi:hypothetical protein CGRA01v4_10105 [Colletotrichum graminicola]|nr:hypothetical protein CGRA01v4_10105 [Colletotrichum graminicola]